MMVPIEFLSSVRMDSGRVVRHPGANSTNASRVGVKAMVPSVTRRVFPRWTKKALEGILMRPIDSQGKNAPFSTFTISASSTIDYLLQHQNELRPIQTTVDGKLRCLSEMH